MTSNIPTSFRMLKYNPANVNNATVFNTLFKPVPIKSLICPSPNPQIIQATTGTTTKIGGKETLPVNNSATMTSNMRKPTAVNI